MRFQKIQAMVLAKVCSLARAHYFDRQLAQMLYADRLDGREQAMLVRAVYLRRLDGVGSDDNHPRVLQAHGIANVGKEIYTYFSTARKSGIKALAALRLAFMGAPFLSSFVAPLP